jgi:hypothetical protein
MKIIKTSQNKSVTVCDCHYKYVNKYKWSALKLGRHEPFQYAAVRFGNRVGRKPGLILMHREIMSCPSGMVVDHIDGDPSNNQCNNLRICTQAQNALNNQRAKHNSISGHKGVYWHKSANKWCAEVTVNKKKQYLGVFEDLQDAVNAYNIKAKELHGEFFASS